MSLWPGNSPLMIGVLFQESAFFGPVKYSIVPLHPDTCDGQLNQFRPGNIRVLKKNPVPAIPGALQGLCSSLFS